MEGKHWLGLVVGVVALWCVVHWARDPLRTTLPFGTTDLSSVQAPLARLKPDERALVEAYVKRSNGDVLMPSMADPDAPLTARNFSQAIALEKKWQEKMRVQKVAADARAAERDAALAPLREAVTAKVTRREIVDSQSLYAPADGSGAKVAHSSNGHPVFVATITVFNHVNSDIVALQGGLSANDRDNYLPMQICWIDNKTPIAALGRIDIRCANANRQADAVEQAFIDDLPGRFEVVWTPRRIQFADGKVLEVSIDIAP